MTNQNIAKLINDAKPCEVTPPLPLRKTSRPSIAYPLDALGSLLGEAAKAIHEKIQAPEPICAQSVLAAATLAVQGHADIELPTGQSRPISCFFMSIATTGERKSSCDAEALKPIINNEEDMRKEYETDYAQWKNKKEIWEKERSDILNKTKKGAAQEHLKASLDALGLCPEEPLIPMLTCSEPTFEGLCRYFVTGQPSIGVFSDEGGQFLGGHGMNKDNQMKTAGAFCSLWDGKPIKRLRSVDGIAILPGRRLSVHLMAQPSVASIVLSNPMFEDQGLLSRFLFSAPESIIGTRFSKPISPEFQKALKLYNTKLTEILNIPLPLMGVAQNVLNPRKLAFDDGSKRIWTGFSDEVEKNMAKGGVWEQIIGFANKLPEHAARIAAVLALIDDINAKVITKHYLYSGIALASYYAEEALRLQDQGYVNPDILMSEKLLFWLHNNWIEDHVSLPDIYQRGLYGIRQKSIASRIVSILEEHGYLLKLDEGGVVNGVKRKDVWFIVKV